MEIINAKIKFSFLGIDEEGTPLMQLGFEGRNGFSYLTDKVTFIEATLIKDILNTLEVRSWEELPRKFARIKLDGKRVVAVGNLIEEKWVEVR